MYTLSKAKEEIDLVAQHATDIAAHMIALGGTMETKLESFKAEILGAIESKFADLARTIHGDATATDTSAVADLGAKVSLLTRGPAPSLPPSGPAHEPEPYFNGNQSSDNRAPDHDDQN